MKRKNLTLTEFLNEINKQQKHYPILKGKTLNDSALKKLYLLGKTPIEALNDLITIT